MTDLYPANPHLWMPVHSEALADYARRGDWDQFAAKLEENHRAIEDHRHPSGGNKPYATIVIAAADSTAVDRANADFVCSGTGDDATINAAIAAISSSVGGKVLLLEGTFNCTSSITINKARCHLQGLGEGTFVKATGGVTNLVNITANNVRVSHLWVWGNALATNGIRVQNGATEATVESCYVSQCSSGIFVNGSVPVRPRIIGCTVVTCSSHAINVQSADSAVIVGNMARSSTGSGSGIRISAAGESGHVVAGNDCEANAGSGIEIAGSSTGSVVANNTCRGNTTSGIKISSSSAYWHVTGNLCARNGAHGIDADDATNVDCTIDGNFCRDNSRGSASTYDGIIVGGTDMTVTGNRCRKGTSGNTQKYGIEVTANGTTVLVVNNDLKNGGATSAYSDSGTSTATNLDGSANNWNRT